MSSKKGSRKKSRKLLPQPDPDVHLSDDGYSTNKSAKSRQRALTRASKKYGSLSVMRRLNLIRNLSRKGSKQKKIMSKDVEYLKKKYSKSKRSKRSKSRK